MKAVSVFLLILIGSYSIIFGQTPPFTSKFTFDDMFRIKKIYRSALSPDGQFVAFEVREADSTENKWLSNLWLADVRSGETIQLTRGTQTESKPRWSPDGKMIAFLSKRDEHQNIFYIPNAGGETRPLFSHPAKITDFRFANRNSLIYFLAEDSMELNPEIKEYDAYYYDHTEKPVQLWVYDRTAKTSRQLTEGDNSIREFCLSPDEQQLVFSAAPSPRENDYLKVEIFLLDLVSGEAQQLTENHIHEKNLAWSPDGQYISFTSDASSQLETYYQDSIFLFSLQSQIIVDLLPDFEEQVFRYFWTQNGDEIFFVANTGVNTQFFLYNRKRGGVRQVTSGDHDIGYVDYRPEVNRMVYTKSTPNEPYEIYFADPDKLPGRRITSINSWMDTYQKAKYRTVHWESADGHQVEGILILPAQASNNPYPLIVQLHGGPESSYRNYFGSSYVTYPQIWAANGYAIFQPNYRGSTGYGDDVMRSIIGHYFEKDIDDIITGIDHLVNEGIADQEKLAVMGWSAGGHLTNWLITHFNRFKAACSGAGGANWYSFYAQTDVQYIREIWHVGPPYSRQDYYMRKSPVTYVEQAKTPTLILCGEADRRVPFPQSLEMYRGLKRYGCPVKFLAFPGEGHGLKKIKHQMLKMKTEFQWIERNLFGRELSLENIK